MLKIPWGTSDTEYTKFSLLRPFLPLALSNSAGRIPRVLWWSSLESSPAGSIITTMALHAHLLPDGSSSETSHPMNIINQSINQYVILRFYFILMTKWWCFNVLTRSTFVPERCSRIFFEKDASQNGVLQLFSLHRSNTPSLTEFRC
jgi:hypothetical protein